MTVARDYKYMCSDPGQDLIKKDIRANGLDSRGRRLLLAHAARSRPSAAPPPSAGINPYLFQMVQHPRAVSRGSHLTSAEATEKAKDLVRAAVRRARSLLEPLEDRYA